MAKYFWTYFVPYHVDTEQTLQELRERVFRKGAYTFSSGALSLTGAIDIDDPDTPHSVELANQAIGYVGDIENLLRLVRAQSRVTGSILDVEYITTDSIDDDHAVRLATAEELIEWFGTSTPSHQHVEEVGQRNSGFRTTSDPVYFIVYKDDFPSEICFDGGSDDRF